MPNVAPLPENAPGTASATTSSAAMAPSSVRRRLTRSSATALVSHAYPPYIQKITPSISVTWKAPVHVGSWTRTLVSCVMVKTKTRSKNSSRVVTVEPCSAVAPAMAARGLGMGAERAALRAHLGEDALEAGLGARVDVCHRRGDGGVDRRDLRVHLVRDGAIARVALAPRAQLDRVHRLAGVHVEDVADTEAEAERVGGGVVHPARREPLVLFLGALERPRVEIARAGVDDLLGHAGAEVGRERLPLDGEHAVALEVAERAVVRDDLEAVAQRLEASARAVAAVRALPHEVGQQPRTLGVPEPRDLLAGALLARAGGLEQQRGEQCVLVAVDVEQLHGRAVLAALGAVEAEASGPALAGGAAALEVADPLPAAVGPLDARDEARHHGLHRVEDEAAVVARLRQRVAEQVQDQLLVGLARRVDAHVRERAGGEEAAQQVVGLGVDRAPARRVRLALRARERLVDPGAHDRQRLGVGAEQRVHGTLVLRAQPRVAVVAVAAAGHRRVVGDVARRLLEVGAEAGALEDLRQEVRRPLAGDVGAAELGDGVVAVADEDALVELGGAIALLPVVAWLRTVALGERVGELVEEEPAEGAGVARVAGEERALHRLGQVDEREHGPVEVREVRRQARALGGGEVVGGVAHGSLTLAPGAVGNRHERRTPG